MTESSFVCPFCPLRCDDLKIASGGGTSRPDAAVCELAAKSWSAVASSATRKPLPTGEVTHAYQRVARSMVAAAEVELNGTCLDIQTARGAIRFAAEQRTLVGSFSTANERAFQARVERDGMLATTIGEARRRTDSIVCIGPVEGRFPRLLERLQSGPEVTKKRVFRIEQDASGTASFGAQLANTRIAIQGGKPQQDALAAWLGSANSVVWVWDAQRLDSNATALLMGINDLLATNIRSALLPISEQQNFRTVALWLAGMAGPIDFRLEEPRLLPWSETMSPDVRIWLQPHPLAPEPPIDDVELVVIGLPSKELASRASCVLPAAVPGLQAPGTTLRGDGTVTLCWQPPESHPDAQAATASAVLEALAAACTELRTAPC